MAPRQFVQPQTAEGIKGCVHIVLMGVSGVCLAYNAVAWCFRKDRHLAVNACLYGALTAFEAYQTTRHWS